jgi:hypothetical protein
MRCRSLIALVLSGLVGWGLVAAATRAQAEPAARAEAETVRWDPPGKTCRFPVPKGTTFATLSDARVAGAVIAGYDPRTRSFPLEDGAGRAFDVRSCRGEVAHLEGPITEKHRDRSDQGWSTSSAEGRVWVERHGIVGERMLVFVVAAAELGFTFHCEGFQALVRLDDGWLVTEAVRFASIEECGTPWARLQLVELGGRLAVIAPLPGGNGETQDASSHWAVLLPERGRLREAGFVQRSRSPGNETLNGRPGLFGMFDAKLSVDAGVLQTEETWTFTRVGTGHFQPGGLVRHVTRTYELADGGLVKTPKGDPTYDADVQ